MAVGFAPGSMISVGAPNGVIHAARRVPAHIRHAGVAQPAVDQTQDAVTAAAMPAPVPAPVKAKAGIGSYLGTALNMLGMVDLLLLPVSAFGHATRKIGEWFDISSFRKVGTKIVGNKVGTETVGGLIPKIHSTKWGDTALGRSSFGLSVGKGVQSSADWVANKVQHIGGDRLFSNPEKHMRRAGQRITDAAKLAKEIPASTHIGIEAELKTIREAIPASAPGAEQSLKIMEEASERIGALVAKDAAAKKAFAGASKNVGKLIETVEKTVAHHEKAIGVRSFSNSIRSLPKTIANVGIKDAVMHGAWAGMSVMSSVGNIKEYRKISKVLAADETASNGKLEAKARRDSRKLLFIKQVADLAGLAVIGWQFIRSGKVHTKRSGSMGGSMLTDMIAFTAPQAAASVAQSMIKGADWVPVYDKLHDAYSRGETISAENYAELLIAASPELAKQKPDVIHAVADHYANQRANPMQIRSDINNGTLAKIIAEVKPLVKPVQHPAADRMQSHSNRHHSHAENVKRKSATFAEHVAKKDAPVERGA